MESIGSGFLEIRAKLATLHEAFNQGVAWYQQEIQSLKQELINKDKEIETLKRQLNEKSS